jgi:membrane protein YqaA with SNARE-associated domain
MYFISFFYFISIWKLKIMEALTTFSHWLSAYGALGMFIIAFLDSTFVPIPSGPDILLIKLAVDNYQFPFKIVQLVLASSIGSTIGCTLLYLIARRGGEKVLQKISIEKRNRVQSLLGRYDVLTLIVVSILPPPFPFKPFILCAAVFNFKLHRFIFGLLIGRTLRFGVLGSLAFYFGESAKDLIAKYGIKLLLGFIAILAIVYLIKFLMDKKKSNPEVQVVASIES